MSTVSLQSAFDEARRALDAGAADKAVAIARHMLVHHPRNIEAQRLLGEALLNVGNAEAAGEAFEQVLAADPESVAAYYGRGLACAALDDRGAAMAAFERALEIQPNLAELRTQLMRLYGETSGSSAQLRLSRAGLARLYTRGGMYGQAVDEFRAVLEADPTRTDVEAALAEGLWRDGQEDEAAQYCRETLARHSDLLKPRLLLGYLLFAGGRPEGEELWRAAAQQDPTLTVARSLFDILPPIRLEEPMLPQFDADELRAQQAEQDAEPVAQPPLVAAVAADVDSPAQPAAAEQRRTPDVEQPWGADEASTPASTATARVYEAGPWVEGQAGADVAGSAAGPPPPRDLLSDDELLASLLGIEPEPPTDGEPQPATPDRPPPDPSGPPPIVVGVTDRAAELDARPFALDDAEAYDVAPFMLDEPGSRAGDDQRPPDTSTLDSWGYGSDSVATSDAGDLGPYTLDELAFNEQPRFTSADLPASPSPPDTAPAHDIGEQSWAGQGDAAPFDELPPDTDAPAADMPAATEPDATPARDVFSLEALADDAASWEQPEQPADVDEEQVPFSLADLGIDPEQLTADRAGVESGERSAADSLAAWESFTARRSNEPSAPGDVAGSEHDVPAGADAPSRTAPAREGGAMTSFSLADLGLTDEEIAALDLQDTELDDETAPPFEPATAPSAASPPAAPGSRSGAAADGAQNGLRGVFEQLEADPDNPSLRLAVARIKAQSGESKEALEHYRQLVRSGQVLDDVVGDLQDLIEDGGDPPLLRRLHRLLGDAFMRQNRVQEAMDQYSWTTQA